MHRHPDFSLRRLVLAAGLIAVLASTLASPLWAGVNVWTPLGPEGGIVWQVVLDPSAPGTLYAASDGGVFKSTDAGATWALSSRGLSDSSVFRLFLDPHHPQHLFANISFDSGIFRSTDGGATWQAPDNIPDGGIVSLAVDPQDPATVYAGTDSSGFWRSTDGGKSWQKRSSPAALLLDLLADPVTPGTLYAATGGTQVFLKSTDGGATWIDETGFLPRLHSGSGAIQIALDPESPAILYASISNDYGAPARTFRSRDGGKHWQPAGPGGLPLATGPGGAVYAGDARSLDHGLTWTTVTPAPTAFITEVVDPTSPTTLYAAALDGVYKSTDGALSWQRIVHGLNATPITAVAVRPTGLPLVYAGVMNLGLVRTRPSGRGWALLGLSGPPRQIVFDPADPALVYARVFDHLDRSTDGGLHWQEIALPAVPARCSAFFQTFALAPGSPGGAGEALYLGLSLPGDQACHGVCAAFKSVDRGASWTCLPLATPVLENLAVAPSAPSVVYAAALTHFWKSVDSGATWTRLDRGVLRLSPSTGFVVVDPTDPQVLYMSTAVGLLKSTDGGITWSLANNGLPTTFLSTVVIDPETPTTLWAGVFGYGVYHSTDGGKHWGPMNGGLRGFSGPLALDPRNPDLLYAGTPNNGVYTLTLEP